MSVIRLQDQFEQTCSEMNSSRLQFCSTSRVGGLLRMLAASLLLVAAQSTALAHAIGIEAKLKEGKVSVEAYYDDDTPASGARVVVEGSDAKVTLEGVTDERGMWSFPVPSPGIYVIRLHAEDGHSTRTRITIPGPGIRDELATTPSDLPISDSPSRATFTGPMRWVMTALGLMLIAGATWFLQRVSRYRQARTQA